MTSGLRLHDGHVVATQAEAKAEREAIQDEGNGDATPLWTDGERAAYGAGLVAASEAKVRAATNVRALRGAQYLDNRTGAEVEPIPSGESALALMEREMALITYLNDPWIPEGLNLLAGRPKIGKTTMQRQKLAAVAEGGLLFGDRCLASPAVYLSLEEGDRLTRQKLESAAFSRDALANITLFFQWRRGADGVLDLLRLLELRPELRYVAIDSLTKFRSIPDQRTPAFVADYEAVSALHGVAKGRPGLCIDVVHHTRKAKSEDPVEDISGTFGVSAACDSYWVMRHHEDGAVLHVGGRLWDRDVSQFQLRRGGQRWELVGEFNGISEVQTATLTAIRSAKGMSPTDGARFWNISRQSMMNRFDGLLNRGLVYSKAGIYYAKD
jgi:hypothetical protein